MRTAKSAEALKAVDLRNLKKDLKAIPEDIKEKFYQKYVAHQLEKKVKKQTDQFLSVKSIGKFIFSSSKLKTIDICMGSKESAIYETFYRQEPSEYMTLPQFITVMCRCFKWDPKDPSIIDLLQRSFIAFDIKDKDQMLWRLFLSQLNILIQPELSCLNHMWWSFALRSSSGYVDRTLPLSDSIDRYERLNHNIQKSININIISSTSPSSIARPISEEERWNCLDNLTLGEIKNMICSPTIFVHHDDIKRAVEEAWVQLTVNSSRARAAQRKNGLQNDPDLILIDAAILHRLFQQSALSDIVKPVNHHYFRDKKSVWMWEFERLHYHPQIYSELSYLRRKRRNEITVQTFRQRRPPRLKRICIQVWKDFMKYRQELRAKVIISFHKQITDRLEFGFYHLRTYAIHDVCANIIQRMTRGFLVRREIQMLRYLHRCAVKIQTVYRGRNVRKFFKILLKTQKHSILTIQRIVRGYLARRYVRMMVLAKVETERHRLKREKARFLHAVEMRAAQIVQFCYRRYAFKRRVWTRHVMKEKAEEIEEEMATLVEQQRVQRLAHRIDVENWYRSHRESYEKSRLREERGRQQMEKIKLLRQNNRNDAKAREKIERRTREERQEEARLEQWHAEWDMKRAQRVRNKEIQCKRVLDEPECHEDLLLRPVLLGKLKQQVKTVLRRADKQRIPMNLPEAQDIARQELIKLEGQAEEAAARRDQIADAQRISEEKRKREEKEKRVLGAYYGRSEGNFAIIIQCAFRAWRARRIVREKAYNMFRKHFDKKSLGYYYQHRITGELSWSKPKCLGSYDVDPDPIWMCIQDSIPNHPEEKGDIYFYNPRSMEMSWDQPPLTILCEICSRDFAIARLSSDKRMYCESCFNTKALEIIKTDTRGAAEMMFKSFQGSLEGSQTLAFSSLKETNLLEFLRSDHIDADCETQRLLAELKKKNEESLANKVDVKKNSKEKTIQRMKCLHCEDIKSGNLNRDGVDSSNHDHKMRTLRDVSIHCHNCGSDYCSVCFANRHDRPPWSEHTTSETTGNNIPTIIRIESNPIKGVKRYEIENIKKNSNHSNNDDKIVVELRQDDLISNI